MVRIHSPRPNLPLKSIILFADPVFGALGAKNPRCPFLALFVHRNWRGPVGWPPHRAPRLLLAIPVHAPAQFAARLPGTMAVSGREGLEQARQWIEDQRASIH